MNVTENKFHMEIHFNTASEDGIPEVSINGQKFGVASYAHNFVTKDDKYPGRQVLSMVGYFPGDPTIHFVSYDSRIGQFILDGKTVKLEEVQNDVQSGF